MSFPDYLLDEDWDYCFEHDKAFQGAKCPECSTDNIDKYADEAYQDRVEGK